jgi:hypothetical protein
MTDIDNLRLLAGERAADDPLTAYALDGCADEIERLRVALRDVIGMLDDPTGLEHVRDMRGATVIARAALRGAKS